MRKKQCVLQCILTLMQSVVEGSGLRVTVRCLSQLCLQQYLSYSISASDAGFFTGKQFCDAGWQC